MKAKLSFKINVRKRGKRSSKFFDVSFTALSKKFTKAKSKLKNYLDRKCVSKMGKCPSLDWNSLFPLSFTVSKITKTNLVWDFFEISVHDEKYLGFEFINQKSEKKPINIFCKPTEQEVKIKFIRINTKLDSIKFASF